MPRLKINPKKINQEIRYKNTNITYRLTDNSIFVKQNTSKYDETGDDKNNDNNNKNNYVQIRAEFVDKP